MDHLLLFSCEFSCLIALLNTLQALLNVFILSWVFLLFSMGVFFIIMSFSCLADNCFSKQSFDQEQLFITLSMSEHTNILHS